MSSEHSTMTVYQQLGSLTTAVETLTKAVDKFDEKTSENRRRMYEQLGDIKDAVSKQGVSMESLSRITARNADSIEALEKRLTLMEHKREGEKSELSRISVVTERFEQYEQRGYGAKATIAFLLVVFGSVLIGIRDKLFKLLS